MGDSARAGTIQLPRAARPPPPAAGPRAGSGDRSLRARSGVRGPPAQLGDGPRSSHQGPTTQGAPEPRRPASGRAVSLPLMPNSAGGPVPAAGFPALPALTPRMPRPVPPSQEKAAASPVSRTLPAGPRENPRLLGGPSVRVLGEGRHHVVAAALGRSIPAGPSPWA